MGKLRAYFLTGVLVTAPITLTFYLAWIVVMFIDNKVRPLIPVQYYPDTYLPFTVPGLGILIVFSGLALVGALAAGALGRYTVSLSERMMHRMPIIRNLYVTFKQITEAVVNQQSNAFREVVMVEYPRRGIWSLGFITGTTKGEVQKLTEDEVVNVFLPTTPNPTSGFLLFLPKGDIRRLDMTVEQGIKMVISAGIVTPQYAGKATDPFPSRRP